MNILDDLFHGCALEAWLEIAEATGQWPPDSESVRRRAYELYEAALRELPRRESGGQACRTVTLVHADEPHDPGRMTHATFTAD